MVIHLPMTIQKNVLDSPLEMTSLQVHPLKQKVPAGLLSHQTSLALCTQSSWKWARTGASLCALRHKNHAMIVPPAWFSRVLELSVSAFICWTQKFLLPGLWQRKHTNLRTSFFMTALPVHRPFLPHPVKKKKKVLRFIKIKTLYM